MRLLHQRLQLLMVWTQQTGAALQVSQLCVCDLKQVVQGGL
jgi:hypothetical protein